MRYKKDGKKRRKCANNIVCVRDSLNLVIVCKKPVSHSLNECVGGDKFECVNTFYVTGYVLRLNINGYFARLESSVDLNCQHRVSIMASIVWFLHFLHRNSFSRIKQHPTDDLGFIFVQRIRL